MQPKRHTNRLLLAMGLLNILVIIGATIFIKNAQASICQQYPSIRVSIKGQLTAATSPRNTFIIKTRRQSYRVIPANTLVANQLSQLKNQSAVVKVGGKRVIKGVTFYISYGAKRDTSPTPTPKNSPSASPVPASPTPSPMPTVSSGILKINELKPSSGRILTTVTISGEGFSRTGNHINIDKVSKYYSNVPSFDGKNILFQFPANPSCTTQHGGICSMIAVDGGTFPISVTNSAGQTSNALPFTVISGGRPN